MAKEQAALEIMQEVSEEQLQVKPAEIEAVEELEVLLQPEPVEKPKSLKKPANGRKLIRYIGRNPSYTIGRHRFEKGGVPQEIEKELAEYALKQDCFEEG